MTTAPASTSVQRVRSATIGAVLFVTGAAQFFIARRCRERVDLARVQLAGQPHRRPRCHRVRAGPARRVLSAPLRMNAAFVLQGIPLLAGIAALIGSRCFQAGPRAWQIMVAISESSWILLGLILGIARLPQAGATSPAQPARNGVSWVANASAPAS